MSSRRGTFRGSRPQGQTLRTRRPGAEGRVWGQKDDTPRRGAWPPPAGLPVRAAGRRWGGHGFVAECPARQGACNITLQSAAVNHEDERN